ARIFDYSGAGALGAWVRIAAVRTALSLRRKREPLPLDDDAGPPDPAVPLDVGLVRRRYARALRSAVQAAVEALPGEDRELLRQHFIEGMTVDRLGAMKGVHGSTISRRIARARGA